jgi:hypothetical protein
MYEPIPPTPLSELKRNALAALAVLLSVGIGTLIVAALFGLPTH